MRRRFIPVLTGLAVAVGLLTGCGKSSTNPATSTDLSGSYTLQSLTQSGITLAPPVATGTLVLTATNYTLDMTVPNGTGGTQQVQDAGTYTAKSDGTWSQSSTTSSTQSVGTYTLSGSTLSVNVTTEGQQVATVWHKQ